MARDRWYSLDEAAGRMGVSRQRVGQMVDAGDLRRSEADAPGKTLVEAAAVEARRREKLEKFSDVLDTTGLADQAVVSLAEAEARARAAETWLRISAASGELFDDGVRKMAESRQLLIDALLTALPDEGRTPPSSTQRAR